MGLTARTATKRRHAQGVGRGCVAVCLAACAVLPLAAGAQAEAEVQAEVQVQAVTEPEPEPARLSGPPAVVTLASTEPAPRLPKVDLTLLMPSPMLQGSRPLDPVQMLQQAQGVRHDHALSLGLRWRTEPIIGRTLDISVWRQITPVSSLTGVLGRGEAYGAQVELQLASERMAALRDVLGFKLANGARISLRRKNGQTTIYFRMQF